MIQNTSITFLWLLWLLELYQSTTNIKPMWCKMWSCWYNWVLQCQFCCFLKQFDSHPLKMNLISSNMFIYREECGSWRDGSAGMSSSRGPRFEYQQSHSCLHWICLQPSSRVQHPLLVSMDTLYLWCKDICGRKTPIQKTTKMLNLIFLMWNKL